MSYINLLWEPYVPKHGNKHWKAGSSALKVHNCLLRDLNGMIDQWQLLAHGPRLLQLRKVVACSAANDDDECIVGTLIWGRLLGNRMIKVSYCIFVKNPQVCKIFQKGGGNQEVKI